MPQDFNALATLQAFGAGRDMRNQRQAQEQAQQLQQNSVGVNRLLMDGNTEKAGAFAAQSGSPELMGQVREQVAQMDAQQQAELERRTRAMGSLGAALLQVPQEQRLQALQSPQFAQAAQGFGIDVSQYTPDQLTDANLQAFIGLASTTHQEVTALLDRSAPVTLGQGDQRIVTQNGQQNVAAENVDERIPIAQQNADTARIRASRPAGPGVVVQTGNQGPQIGSIPAGYQAVQDPSTGGYRMEPIPGSPAAAEAAREAEQAEMRQGQAEQFSGIAVDDIGRAISLLEENPGAGGRNAAVMRFDPESQSRELERLYSTIGAYTSFDRLQRMRESSPTGGALGAVSERELSMLQNAYGALDPTAPPETQLYNLRRLNDLILDVVHGRGNRPSEQPTQSTPRGNRRRYNPETGQVE